MRRAVAVLLVLVMLGSVVSPAMGATTAKMKPIPTTERMELHKNINIIKIDPALENATPYWIIIAAGSMEKGRAVTFKYIDSSTSLTKEEKIELKKFVKELWKKYRVKTIKDGNITLITLNSKVEINLTQEEEAMLDKVVQAVNEYFRTKYGGVIGILWNVDTHQSIIYISCKKWGESDYYCGVARDHADDPDYWTQVPPPPRYPNWLWDFIMQVVHSWTHYYNPDWGIGSAPSETKYYADTAKNKYSSGYKYSAFQNLGYASHFMTDVGNPLHTGLESWQAVFKDIHYAYEDYVSSNWESGYNFKSVIENNWYYYAINDPEQATKDLASYSHQYDDTIFWTIYWNPDTWQSNSNIKDATENSLLETAKYTLGLVKYVRG
ncbi:conserved hypothetical protein [Ferroglobus placidus DSM 10642]|uniref:Uncharacterized protein n=1 Tax=Ferroglobus placidus (strain DSM 10642 / AEDII12DO) TaxID=589924 RepID=D3RY11_FERPA|nr:hypothetical protein [Ferroglobus placidus]ADC65374.1 conserved hypothetical protein [Ferroglobus placidus DSM 10642]